MGVRTTAFGPTFDSESDADDFLDYLDDKEAGDPRSIAEDVLAAYFQDWKGTDHVGP